MCDLRDTGHVDVEEDSDTDVKGHDRDSGSNQLNQEHHDCHDNQDELYAHLGAGDAEEDESYDPDYAPEGTNMDGVDRPAELKQTNARILVSRRRSTRLRKAAARKAAGAW